MAFMHVEKSSGEGGSDRLPYAQYDARAGRFFLVNRTQGADGMWASEKIDITMQMLQGPMFAIDFPSLEVGWLHFSNQGPLTNLVPYGTPLPPRPPSPGADDKGKALQFRQGFRVKIIGSQIGGVREISGNAGVFIEGMNALHTAYDNAPERAQGKIPLVKLANTLPVKSGQSTNYQPVMDIVSWVDRPAALGAPPAAPRATSGGTAPAMAVHVPPPAQAAPVTAPKVLVDDDVPF